MSKIQLGVMFGSRSCEHEVSIISAVQLMRAADRQIYDVIPIYISKKGEWFTGDALLEISAYTPFDESRKGVVRVNLDITAGSGALTRLEHGKGLLGKDREVIVARLDCVIPVFHGMHGEDGTIQGLFQLSGIPFVGCDTLASAVCMDKAVTNILLEAAGIDQANFMWFYASDYENVKEQVKEDIMADLGGYPVFVKPANAGSSVGVSKAKNAAELDKAVAIAAKEDKKIVIEECIVGKEVECAVMGNAIPKVSVVGEIAPSAEFYDYEDKYKNGTSKVYIPAPLDDELSAEICNTAAKAYRALGCSGLSRVDFFVRDSDNAILLNEINTLPGFTSISMYSMLWKACGIDYGHLLDHIIQFAFDK